MLIKLPEGVTIAGLSEKKLKRIWKELQSSPKVFVDKAVYKDFYSHWMSPKTIVLEIGHEKGFILFDCLRLGVTGRVHAYFFDRKLHDKIDLLKDVFLWMFFQFQLERIECLVPEHSHAVRRFMKTLGFTYEGRLRRYLKYKGESVDGLMFSILKEEI